MDWSLPLNASTQGEAIDNLFRLIFWITVTAFVVVEAGVVWFLWKYRGRKGRQARYTHGNATAEVIWTTIPAVVMVFLGIYSGRVWASIRSSDSYPDDALTIGVMAKQFEWIVTYPGEDRMLGNADDFTIRNRFEIPVNEPVIVMLESEDAIHSFFIPEMRVKQDAVPGMTIPIWFEAIRTGEFQIACAELCGLGHYRMRARVVVHDPTSYEAWYDERSAEAFAAEE
jgi:cytochrome c oxidase subunit 2